MRFSAWMGQPLPQRTNIGELDIVLASLELRTNGGPKQRWETPARYWEPAWELRRRGVPVTDWETPEWSATDATGNQGRFLGVHQPVLRFTVGFYPTATNLDPTVVELLTNLPSVNLTSVSSTNWVKIPARFGSQDVLLLGLVSAGTYIFENGLVVSNAPVSAGAVSGGARSGWVGHSRRVSPTQVQSWNSHYTPDPVIYVHAAALKNEQRLAVRLRDADGRYWPTTPEPQGNPQGILAFLVGELPADVHVVTAEVVVLKPVRATFDVEMKR